MTRQKLPNHKGSLNWRSKQLLVKIFTILPKAYPQKFILLLLKKTFPFFYVNMDSNQGFKHEIHNFIESKKYLI